MPAEAFAGAKQLVRRAVGDGWAELTRRIPTWQPRYDDAGG